MQKGEVIRKSVLCGGGFHYLPDVIEKYPGTSGYLVVTAVDGIDALTLLKSEKFDIVVSDVDMPRMNGLT